MTVAHGAPLGRGDKLRYDVVNLSRHVVLVMLLIVVDNFSILSSTAKSSRFRRKFIFIGNAV